MHPDQFPRTRCRWCFTDLTAASQRPLKCNEGKGVGLSDPSPSLTMAAWILSAPKDPEVKISRETGCCSQIQEQWLKVARLCCVPPFSVCRRETEWVERRAARRSVASHRASKEHVLNAPQPEVACRCWGMDLKENAGSWDWLQCLFTKWYLAQLEASMLEFSKADESICRVGRNKSQVELPYFEILTYGDSSVLYKLVTPRRYSLQARRLKYRDKSLARSPGFPVVKCNIIRWSGGSLRSCGRLASQSLSCEPSLCVPIH